MTPAALNFRSKRTFNFLPLTGISFLRKLEKFSLPTVLPPHPALTLLTLPLIPLLLKLLPALILITPPHLLTLLPLPDLHTSMLLLANPLLTNNITTLFPSNPSLQPTDQFIYWNSTVELCLGLLMDAPTPYLHSSPYIQPTFPLIIKLVLSYNSSYKLSICFPSLHFLFYLRVNLVFPHLKHLTIRGTLTPLILTQAMDNSQQLKSLRFLQWNAKDHNSKKGELSRISDRHNCYPRNLA